MNSCSAASRKVIKLAVIAIAFIGASCSTATKGPDSTGKPLCCATNVAFSGKFTDKSLYQLDSMWTNDTGRLLKLGALQDRVQVVAMFFTSCTVACPILVQDMKRIETALPKDLRGKVGFILVTMDTDRDTPEALRAYRTVRSLPVDRWTLLRGTPDDTLELAALLGVKFKREATGQFAHSNLITILNKEGEVVHQIAGLNQDVADTVNLIEKTVTSSGPTHHHTVE